jgi:hypothetical protein
MFPIDNTKDSDTSFINDRQSERTKKRTKLLQECDSFDKACKISAMSLRGEFPLLSYTDHMVNDKGFSNDGLEHDSEIMAKINQNGFYTCDSQVGKIGEYNDKGISMQHQYVQGMVTFEKFRELEKALSDSSIYPKKLPNNVKAIRKNKFKIGSDDRVFPVTFVKNLPLMLPSGYAIIKHIDDHSNFVCDFNRFPNNKIGIAVTFDDGKVFTHIDNDNTQIYDLPEEIKEPKKILLECIGISIIDFIPGRNELLPILDNILSK